MIFIPNNAKVSIGITQGSIYNFSPTDGIDNHYHIILNKNPKNDDQIFLVHFTTKKQKTLDFINNRNLDISTFVEINNGECLFLPRWEETCINCNYVKVSDINEIVDLIDNSNGSCNYSQVPESLMKRIIIGVSNSKMVANTIKTSL